MSWRRVRFSGVLKQSFVQRKRKEMGKDVTSTLLISYYNIWFLLKTISNFRDPSIKSEPISAESSQNITVKIEPRSRPMSLSLLNLNSSPVPVLVQLFGFATCFSLRFPHSMCFTSILLFHLSLLFLRALGLFL